MLPSRSLILLSLMIGVALPISGCVSNAKARQQARAAYIAGQQDAMLKIGASPTSKGTFKFKTIQTDFSGVEMVNHDVEVELEAGSHTVSDSRLWEVKGTNLKSSK